jgi:hypothetical protein
MTSLSAKQAAYLDAIGYPPENAHIWDRKNTPNPYPEKV